MDLVKNLRRMAGKILRFPGQVVGYFLQNKALATAPIDAEKLVLFLVPTRDDVNGGLMSICSLASESQALKEIHGGEVLLVGFPGMPPLYRYTKFRNEWTIFRFGQVRRNFKARHILLHVPEYLTDKLVNALDAADKAWLAQVNLHINILMQNVEMMPETAVQEMQKLTSSVTVTTVHRSTTSPEMRAKLGVPLHRFSVFNNPRSYVRLPFAQKANRLLVSPDRHPQKDAILKGIHEARPDMEIRIIRGLKYQDYLKLVSESRWSLTFGEGVDNYFSEMAWSAGVPFTVQNDLFFTEDMKALPTVYATWEALAESLPKAMASMEADAALYEATNAQVCAALGKHYDFEEYLNNIKAFYQGVYTYP